MYDLIFRLVLSRLDAETVHTATIRLLTFLQRVPGAVWLLTQMMGSPDPRLAVDCLGLRFPSPLGMAAGFDKDAEVFSALGAFGFGFVEVGTLTGHAQPGNPRPRMFRLPLDRALINRMGFNNHGAAAATSRLRNRGGRPPIVGVNIGKTKIVPAEQAAADYVHSAGLLAPHADYLVVNVSSPNTPGLRDLQTIDSLRPLLHAVQLVCQATANNPPVLVKIAPDLTDEDVDAVADLAVELSLDGIIASNTTIAREGLDSAPRRVQQAGAGGLSGAPLNQRSLSLLRRLHARVGDQIVLVSVGGVENAQDVWERLTAGASLVQVYTGLVYGGPGFVRTINRDLKERMASAGLTRLKDVIGTVSTDSKCGLTGPGGHVSTSSIGSD